MKNNYFLKMQYAAYKRQRRRAFWRLIKETAPDIIGGAFTALVCFVAVVLWFLI